MMYYTNTKNQGFSLVETLVAISILLLVVTGPMTISMRTAKSTSFASEQVQAFFLAQEGLELAQKGRDDLLLQYFLPATDPLHITDPWDRFTDTSGTGLFQQCYQPTGCKMHWHPNPATGNMDAVGSCSAADSCRLYISDSGRSRFTHSSAAGNIPTPFTRRIYFTEDNVSGGIKVESLVTWRTGSLVAEQRVSTVTYLYNTYGL